MTMPGRTSADIMVALGGDGFMLQTLHAFLGKGKPIYGMNVGSVGFLMNEYRAGRSAGAAGGRRARVVHPLRMQAHTAKGVTEALAFNEVSLLRETRQAAKIRIHGGWPAAHRRTDLRWRAGVHARRFDRL